LPVESALWETPASSTSPTAVSAGSTKPSGCISQRGTPVAGSSAAMAPGKPSVVAPPATNTLPLATAPLTMVLSPKSGDAPGPLITLVQRIPPAR